MLAPLMLSAQAPVLSQAAPPRSGQTGAAETPAGEAAPDAELPPEEIAGMCMRIGQLIDAGGFLLPELGRAAEPVAQNIRLACEALDSEPGTGQPTYALLNNIRAYLTLSDAVPKPYPFPEAARDQFRELRDITLDLEAHFNTLLTVKEQVILSTDRDDVSHFRQENRLLDPPEANGRRVVFLGDSITALWRLNEYFPEEDFLNRSIEGQFTGQLLGRMKSDVLDLHPKAVLIQGGTFDLVRETPLVDIEDNYVLMADIADANRIKVMFASVLPVNDYKADVNPDYRRTRQRPAIFIKALNDWLKAFCISRGYTYVDYASALSDENGMLREDASEDGLHPNGTGYRLMAPVLAQAVQEATR